MKSYFTLLILAFLPSFTIAQPNCQAIVVSDSLFQAKSDHFNFEVSEGGIRKNILREQVKDLSQILKIKEGCRELRISFGCCYGNVEAFLVTDGKIHIDNHGETFFLLKLHFCNPEFCKKLCRENYSFDLDGFMKDSGVKHIKFIDFDELFQVYD